MKNQVLLILVVSLMIPLLFPLALRKDSHRFRPLSGKPKPAAVEHRHLSIKPAEEFSKNTSGKDHDMNRKIFQNKQINFWIP